MWSEQTGLENTYNLHTSRERTPVKMGKNKERTGKAWIVPIVVRVVQEDDSAISVGIDYIENLYATEPSKYFSCFSSPRLHYSITKWRDMENGILS